MAEPNAEYAPCGCRPGFTRCNEANGHWEAANAVYRSRGYAAWLKSLEPYNEHMAQVEAQLAAQIDSSETEKA